MAIRILHISTRLILGGSQENTVLSCEGQARLGHDVHLAFGPIYGPEGSMLERVGAFKTDDGRGITTHEVASLVREVNPKGDRACVGELKRLIEEIRPDVVHTHSSKAGVVGRSAAWAVLQDAIRGSGGPTPAVIHTVHGPPFMPVEGGGVQRLKVRAKNRVYVAAERHAARRCHRIVSVADAMTSQFLERGIGKPEQYVTVRSGMEIGGFLEPGPGESRDEMRAKLGIEPDDFVVGTVARLAEHKGHDDVLDALGREMSMGTKKRWKLLWVGDGWWRERLTGRIKELGITDRVVITGLVPPEDVARHMRAMDVLCHPSYREGLPRTVPQALLCGVGVIASDVDGTREVCIEGQTGKLIPAANPQAIKDAVRWMADHPQQRKRMAEQGREMCRTAFSAETMVGELERVYADAMALARGSGAGASVGGGGSVSGSG